MRISINFLKNKQFIISLIAIIFVFLLQYLLFFFEKSVYLSLLCLLVFYICLIFYRFSSRLYYYLLIILFVLTPFSYLISRDFANYFGANFVISLLFIAIHFLHEKRFKSKDLFLKRKLFMILTLVFLLLFAITINFVIDNKKTEKVIQKLRKPEEYYVKLDKISINDKIYENNIQIYIDIPENNSEVTGLFKIEGWTADINELSDSVIEDVYFFLDNKPENGGKFLGKKYTWIRREDVQRAFGEKYKDSGYYYEINSNMLENGLHKLYVYAKSNYFGWNYSVLNFVVDN